MASCLLNKATLWTALPSWITGFGFEMAQQVTGVGVFDPADIDANTYGVISSYKGDCEAECSQCPNF